MLQPLKAPLLLKLLQSSEVQDALVFTRTKHRADRLAKYLAEPQGQRRADPRQPLAGAADRRRWTGSRRGATRCSSRPTSRRAASTSTALGHVINFDVPMQPDDYIHRVGRTARAEMTGSAFTLVSSEEEGDLRAIEKAIGRRLPRVTVPDFDYESAPAERLEVPHAQRIAEIRARKAEERARARANAERRAMHGGQRPPQGPGGGRPPQGPWQRTAAAARRPRPSRAATGRPGGHGRPGGGPPRHGAGGHGRPGGGPPRGPRRQGPR